MVVLIFNSTEKRHKVVLMRWILNLECPDCQQAHPVCRMAAENGAYSSRPLEAPLPNSRSTVKTFEPGDRLSLGQLCISFLGRNANSDLSYFRMACTSLKNGKTYRGRCSVTLIMSYVHYTGKEFVIDEFEFLKSRIRGLDFSPLSQGVRLNSKLYWKVKIE